VITDLILLGIVTVVAVCLRGVPGHDPAQAKLDKPTEPGDNEEATE